MTSRNEDPALRKLAEAEGRTTDQLVADAVVFYCRLHPAARRSLQAIAALGEVEGAGNAAQASSRAIVNVGFDVVRPHGREAARRTYTEVHLETEEGIEA